MTRPTTDKGENLEALKAERRQQTLIGALVCVLVVALVLVVVFAVVRSQPQSGTAVDQAYAKLQQVADKPSNATKQGGVLISVDGAPKKHVPTIEMYLDPLCPACAQVDRALNPTLQKLFEAGQINVDVHAVTFLNRASSDKYSTRAASSLAYVAEHDPKHAIAFIGELYAEDYLPSESDYTSTGDAQIAQQAVKAGVSQGIAEASVTSGYGSWVDRATTYTIDRTELVQNGSSGFTTPLFRINGHIWERQQIDNADLPEAFAKSLGLSVSDVGNAEVLPRIGADGAIATIE
ncbi:DsbA family protein [Bifidobacterium crudilactis]|uniref:DsbA family protein n=1 Tax=Bifidobacterium crudilactis TaxID=327277 RepID=UPI0023528BD8|nr:DsbA family protein [Bifidobacterium crudilactis]